MAIKVKDTLLLAAELLGISEEVQGYVSGDETSVGERQTTLLLTCFHTVENELALDYLPLTVEEEVVTATGQVAYSDLTRTVAKVLCIEDEWGNSVKYKLYPTYIKAKAGKLRVYYTYTPAQKTLEEESEYQTDVSMRLLAYGVASAYSLAVGEMETAGAWESKYKEGIRAAYSMRPCKRIRSRRWA